MTRTLKLLLPFTLLMLLFGCQSMDERRQAESLRQTLRSFETALRWDRMEHAYGFLDPEVMQQQSLPTHLDDLRVVRYEVLEPPVFLKDERVMQLVLLQYVHESRQVVKTIQDRQYWRFDDERQRWLRTNPIPDFE